jgi:hypothetical protein
VARRDSALKGGAWLLVVATVGGFGFFAQRVFFKVKTDLAEVKAEPPPPAPPPPLRPEERLKRCRDAFEAAPTNGWLEAVSACEEATRYFPEDERPNGPPAEGSTGVRSLARHARRQLECEQALGKGLGFLDGGRVEEASFALAGIAPECAVKGPAVELEASLKPELIRLAAEQCEKRADQGRWQPTFDACERYVELKYCPGALKELEVPKGKYLDLYDAASGKKGKGWRPEDPLLVHFLTAIKALHNDRGPWRCGTRFEAAKPLGSMPTIIRGTNDVPVRPVKKTVKKVK